MRNTVECIWCGNKFERSRRWGYFCETCRIKRNREKARQISAQRYAEFSESVSALRTSLGEEYIPKIDEYMATLELGEGEEVGLVHDRMPDGANSPYGPDEGRSTFFKDLAADLDYACKQTAKHEWWSENPHWTFELHDKAEAAVYFAELEQARSAEPDGCGERKGEYAGYMRHNRKGERPCRACLEAKNAYRANSVTF